MGMKTRKLLETLAVFDVQSFRPHVLAGLIEMNPTSQKFRLPGAKY